MGLAVALRRGRGPVHGGVAVSSEGRARAGLSLLLLFTLFSFAQIFASGDWLGPILLGMMGAGGIAVGARRLGAGTGTTVVVSAIALFLYLVLIFQARNSFFLLPSPDAVEGLWRSIRAAMRHSNVDFAPVPVRTGYVVLVVIGMWTATTVGEIATFRWRRPLLAALPCIGLFCLQMTVGTGNGAPLLVVLFLLALLTFWGLESAHRVRSWGRWVSAFPGASPSRPRAGTEPDSVTGPLARRMGAGCVAAAIVAPLIVPALGDGLLAWRNDVGAGDFGFAGATGRVDPFVSLAPQLIDQSSQPLFEVSAERAAYWRLTSLVEFDGVDWEPLEDTEELDVSELGSFNGTSDFASTVPVEQTVTFDAFESTKLPAAINPTEIRLDADRPLKFDLDTQDLTLDDQAGEGFSYTVVSNVPDLTFEELTDAEVGFLPDAYTEVPVVTARVEGLAADLSQGGELSPGEFLVALQDHLRTNFDYDASESYVDAAGARGASIDYLDQFLFEIPRGYCQQFATAFALLARLQDIPTRVSIGFLPGSRDVSEGTFQVSGLHTHAWPEVYFEDYGWVAFDPTPRQLAREPRYTRPETESGGDFSGPGIVPGGGGVGAALERQDRRLAGANVGAALLGDAERATGGEFGAGDVAENPVWTRTFNRLALAILVALALFLASVP
ncbi:MAG: DUF3488 and transglutaminase-like domain-containing protein, partial [Actinomycetota bacterium]|nr:DUF3488 and transglutaminase-like domain-containing protein [Actinomycetota bacterium]